MKYGNNEKTAERISMKTTRTGRNLSARQNTVLGIYSWRRLLGCGSSPLLEQEWRGGRAGGEEPLIVGIGSQT